MALLQFDSLSSILSHSISSLSVLFPLATEAFIKFHFWSNSARWLSMLFFRLSKVSFVILEKITTMSIIVHPSHLACCSVYVLYAFSQSPIIVTTFGSQLRFIIRMSKSLLFCYCLDLLASAFPLPPIDVAVCSGSVMFLVMICQILLSSWS